MAVASTRDGIVRWARVVKGYSTGEYYRFCTEFHEARGLVWCFARIGGTAMMGTRQRCWSWSNVLVLSAISASSGLGLLSTKLRLHDHEMRALIRVLE